VSILTTSSGARASVQNIQEIQDRTQDVMKRIENESTLKSTSPEYTTIHNHLREVTQLFYDFVSWQNQHEKEKTSR
jgi:hypothetical protein